MVWGNLNVYTVATSTYSFKKLVELVHALLKLCIVGVTGLEICSLDVLLMPASLITQDISEG